MKIIVLTFDPSGNGHGLFTEAIDLSSLGSLEIVRASQIEFIHPTQEWEVTSTEGLPLFHHPSRQACLDWEQQYFNR